MSCNKPIQPEKAPSWQDIIVVQAGGKGSRLGYLTANRPKCLVPIENRPMLFHLFAQFPHARYIIIGDTHYEVLRRYLSIFATVDYSLVKSTGQQGTLAGLAEAVKLIPAQVPFMYIWSDLILPNAVAFPSIPGNYIGIGRDLPCRWRFKNNVIEEVPSSTDGIAGVFLIAGKYVLGAIPNAGQFVKFISGMAYKFKTWPISGIREYGLLEKYESEHRPICRPFNKVEFHQNYIVKKAITPQGRELAIKEQDWYKNIDNDQISTPEIMRYDPLTMQRIKGVTISEIKSLDINEQDIIIDKIVKEMQKLHNLAIVPTDEVSFYENYIEKTYQRLNKISELVPFAAQKYININGQKCRNPLFNREIVEKLIKKYLPEHFYFIHGDPTFSNLMRDEDNRVIMIDPRGYFGHTRLYGDRAYDYAKIYYSLTGNYDSFNKKKFRIYISNNKVYIFIESGGWESRKSTFLNKLPTDISEAQLDLLHSLIWLGLTTYAWEDYDSICGAFYMGTLLLEEALNEHHL